MLKIIRKNFKLLSRSRSSALIIILGPLLMIFLVGMAFNNSDQYQVNVGVYSSSYSDLSTALVAGLQENGYKVTRYQTALSCSDGIKQGSEHICVVFSPDLDVMSGSDNQINFSVDYSKVNLVWMVLDAVSQEISQKSSILTTDMTAVLIDKLEQTKEEMRKDSRIILELTAGNKKIADRAKDSLDKIRSMRLDVNMDDYPVDDLAAHASGVDEYVGYLILHTNSLISGVTGDILALDINASDKKPIFDAMDQAKQKISSVSESLETRMINMSEAAIQLESNVRQLKRDLDQAYAFQSTTTTQLDEIRVAAAEELQNIIALKNSFDKIENEIASIQVFDAEDIAQPIKTAIIPVSAESTHLNNLFPSLVLLVVMFISLLLSSTLVIMEKRSKAYIRNLLVPTNDIVFVLATFATAFIVVFFQVIILLLAAQLFFRVSVFSGLHLSMLSLFMAATVFILIGMAIGYVFSREEATTLASISVGSIMLFLSSVIIPIESMPAYIANIVRFNPFVIGESLFRKSVLFSSPFNALRNELLVLMVYAVILFSAILFLQYLMKKIYIIGAKHQANVKKR